MTTDKNRTPSRRQRRKQKGEGASGPDPRGDLPPRKKCTYTTLSCRVPRTTQQVTLRQSTISQLTQTSSAQFPTYNFQLASIPGASAIAIWDQYRIDCVRFSITPTQNALGTTTNATQMYSEIYCVLDYDDSTALTTTNQALKYDNCIMLLPAESLVRTFQPKMALAAYSGTFTSYANVAPMWLDTNSSSIQHYGVKLAIAPGVAGQTLFQVWDVQIEYFISFRSLLV